MNIGCVLFHNVNELELTLIHSLLGRAVSCANALETAARAPEPSSTAPPSQPAKHGVFTVATSRHSVQTASGLTLTPTWAFMGTPPLDVLIVPSGVGLPLRDKDKQLLSYVRSSSQQAKLVLGLGSGVAVLGECGLLTGLSVSAPTSLHAYLEQYEILNVNAKHLSRAQIKLQGKPQVKHQGKHQGKHPAKDGERATTASTTASTTAVWSARGGLTSSDVAAELISTLFGDTIKDTVVSALS